MSQKLYILEHKLQKMLKLPKILNMNYELLKHSVEDPVYFLY